MKPRKQRLHSAELRRLDHIAQSLDRIAVALEKLHPINGNNNVVLEQNGDGVMQYAGRDANDIHGNGSIQYENTDSFNNNSNEAIKNLTTALKQ